MRCPRCQGYLYTDCESTRCLNCGNYPSNIPYPEPMRDAYDRTKCTNCQNTPRKGSRLCLACTEYNADYQVKYRERKA